jgi:ribA/ribD-fused uncharacterized protein
MLFGHVDTFYNDGVHSPLSNFYPSPFTDERLWPILTDGFMFATVEHYYQAMKSMDWKLMSEIGSAGSPGRAKRMGRKAPLRPDWEQIKLPVMRRALELKFPTPESELGKYLLGTGNCMLTEGNNWGDRFWGVDRTGENWLGHLLMARRAELRWQDEF